MSLSALRLLLDDALAAPTFPTRQAALFASTHPLPAQQLTALYHQLLPRYAHQPSLYRQLLLLVHISLLRNSPALLSPGLELLEGLVRWRLVVVGWAQGGWGGALGFLETPVQGLVRRCLEGGQEGLLVGLLRNCNSPTSKHNEVGFLLELLLIRKIEKHLEDTSLRQLRALLATILSPTKLKYLQNRPPALHFRRIALLRQQEDRPELYCLQVATSGRLTKSKDVVGTQQLPGWVLQAYSRVPKPLNMTSFRSRSVAEVFQFMSQLEVFASSPQVEELDNYVEEEVFGLLEQFLMGTAMGEGVYRAGWKKMQDCLQLTRTATQEQALCYRSALAAELTHLLSAE